MMQVLHRNNARLVVCHHSEFMFADGRCTHAESAATEDAPSVQGSMQGPAELVTNANIA